MNLTEPQYGDRKRLEEQQAGIPVGRRHGPAQSPQKAPDQGSTSPEVGGLEAVSPHTQRAAWAANLFLKKANEPRPSIAGLDELKSSNLMATQLLIDIAEKTGDGDIYAAVEELMEEEQRVSAYDLFGILAAATMDDMEISEGGFAGDGPTGLVQNDSDIRSAEPGTKKEGSEPTA
jgi:hypothetical protein